MMMMMIRQEILVADNGQVSLTGDIDAQELHNDLLPVIDFVACRRIRTLPHGRVVGTRGWTHATGHVARHQVLKGFPDASAGAFRVPTQCCNVGESL